MDVSDTAISGQYVTAVSENNGKISVSRTNLPDYSKTYAPYDNDYVTETELNNKGYLTAIPSEYVTETELNGKGYLTSIPSEYITETELDSKGYLTSATLPAIPGVINNLTSDSTTDALSAAQGKALKTAIDNISGDIGDLGGGDMMKATYDPDNDGKVENADYADNAEYAKEAGNAARLGDVAASEYVKTNALSTVATSGSYNDLNNKPTIPTTLDGISDTTNYIRMTPAERTKLNGIASGANAYVHPNTHPASIITGLATVATSGSYNDLNNKPTIPTTLDGISDTTNYIRMTPAERTKLNGIASGANAYVHPSTHPASIITGLSTVATSGSYNDLSNKPTIPHRELLVSYTTAGDHTFNTADYPSVNGYYDIILIGAGGGGTNVLYGPGSGGGEVVELYGYPLSGEYIFDVGSGGTVSLEGNAPDGGRTHLCLSSGATLQMAQGGKGASNSTTIFTGIAGGNGGEDGHLTSAPVVGRGGGTRYGLGALYYNDGSGLYQTRAATLGGGGAYLSPGADGAVFIYGYVE